MQLSALQQPARTLTCNCVWHQQQVTLDNALAACSDGTASVTASQLAIPCSPAPLWCSGSCSAYKAGSRSWLKLAMMP